MSLMDYLVWQDYTPGHEFASVQEEEGLELEEKQDVRWGRPVQDPPERIAIRTLTPGEIPDVMSSGWGGLYLSPAAKRIVETHARPEHVQFIPATFAPHLGEADHARWLLNVTATGAYVDREASDYDASTRNPDVIRTIRRLVLKPVPRDAPAVFHMEELLTVLLVRADLAEALRGKLRTPGRIVPAGEYTRGLQRA
jgi:hypothetical protein